MMQRSGQVALLSIWIATTASAAAAPPGLCSRWATPEVQGQLDTSLLPEASGIDIATSGDRLYHNNDGTEPNFLVTGRGGGNPRRVTVEGFDAVDVEDLAVGPCGERTCLFLADVGDNGSRRQSVQIAIIEEQRDFGPTVRPRTIITAHYPDGPHNSEAIALHPSGDLFLVTKAGSGAGRSGPAKVYRLTAAQLAAGGVQTFELRGDIPVPELIGTGVTARQVVTAMDIAPDGSRFLLLTYDYMLEFAVDLTAQLPGDWSKAALHRAAPIEALIQAEAIAYDQDGRSVLYSSESVLGSRAPVMRQRCEE
ncbi:MAG TPA: hypothetical protein VNQ32_07500 [Steroidobacteraceae bacterium]|nr:hypothetical protein [Steroidobacteraceae bacterium]